MRFRTESELPCTSCQELYPASALDRYLWCPPCRKAVRRRGAVWGRGVAILAALGVGLYVALAIGPSGRYTLLYGVAVAVTYVLVGRITRALVEGYYRARGRVESSQV